MSAIKCLKCNGDLEVVDSRDRKNGLVKRRRKLCISCGARYTTYEAPEQAILDQAIERFAIPKKHSSNQRSW